METSSSSSSSAAAPPPSPTSSSSSVSFYDFLDRMRNPASLDLVRSIKSFIVSFSFYPANPDNDGKKVQDFFCSMESALRDHPLWAGATDDEIDRAMEGLEKYVMTKLFSRTFASSPDDSKVDRDVSEKVSYLQTFLRPEHLDIPPILRNESSWLLAEKELQRMNAFKAPHEKLQCIMNCCRVINNLLLNASISENHTLGGADDFLPVLIYVTIKANPPQLHSNLKFIQLYRRQEKLVSEAAYYLTNLVSTKSFIIDLSAKSLSIDEIEFEENMQAAKEANVSSANEEHVPAFNELSTLGNNDTGPSGTSNGKRNVWSHYPFMASVAGDLTVGDVERLLKLYKDVVIKYTNLHEASRRQQSLLNLQHHSEETRAAFSQGGEMNSSHDCSRK
ncbi:hypothetical protein MLD38_001045 [Melastoma candidum]|uniref:Uncharacterized protein n=1 Tax=Melastoma candidum TaxID=119954 RepID=A0ACB9SBA6_9MYRT|nr:hypothetical protein MLD38_001045 [Melastoma candidum]